jgi:hypothetical protein
MSEAPEDDGLEELDELARQQQQRRQIEASQRTLADLVARLNSRYAVVNEAGKAVVYEQRLDPVLERKVLIRIEFEALRKFYMNKRLTVTFKNPQGKPGFRTVTKSEAEWWLENEQRREYLDGVVFDPTGRAPPTCWNLWSGFSIEPRAGDWSLMQNHIYEVICSRNEEHAGYVLNWLARMFQNPSKQGEVALVLRGKKGSGKGLLCQSVRQAWGAHGIHISNAKHLVGNFNAHLRDCVFLFADEAFYAGDKQHEGVLKGLITEPMLPIEGKYQNVVSVRNMLHVAMASNSDWVIPATHDERRYAVFDVSDHRVGQITEYFTPISEQMENGGLAAMVYDMLRRDLAGFDVRNFPLTSALADQKTHSLDSLHRWWLAVLQRGFLYQSRHGTPWFAEWHDFYSTELLWQSYLQWCNATRPFDRKSRVQLGAMMTTLYARSRPREEHPVHEIENIDIDHTLKHGPWLDTYGIVKKAHSSGYFVNDLEMSRARYSDFCDIPCPGATGTDWSPDEQGDGQGDSRLQRRGNGAHAW